MEDLLTCTKYEQVLCLVFDEDEQLVIYRSSNRTDVIEELAVITSDAVQAKSSQSLLKEYLNASKKDRNLQTEEEKRSILMIQQYGKQLRRDLLDDEKAFFDGSQFLFCLPPGWPFNSYEEEKLRMLFMEAGWVTQNDPKSRLIFSSFIDGLFQCLVAYENITLERENKYLLLSMNKTTIHLLTLQMQSAKELIAVSKKLAASDFLLIPSDLGDAVSMDLTKFDVLVHNSVKKIIIRHILSSIRRKRYYMKRSFHFKNGNKNSTQKQRHNINAATQPLFSVTSLHQITQEIIETLYLIFIEKKSKPLHASLYGLEGAREILGDLTCGTFLGELLTDADYSTTRNSPDGIQDVILHCNFQTNIFYMEIFQMALLNADFIDAQTDFICLTQGRDICSGALKKPYKMFQIANALLPPTIWNEESKKQIELMEYDSNEGDLLPPNSFYVQAYISDDHIRFILNKVVTVSSTNDYIQKSTFTLQEVSVKLEGIFDSVCDNMWNHSIMPEYQRDPNLLNHCDTHSAGEYSAENYHVFKCLIKEMVNKLLQRNLVNWNQDIDIDHAIPINEACNCTFQISFRALMDIGLQPVISHIATIIASSLASNSFFGLYAVSALIIMDNSKDMLIQDFSGTFKKTIRSCLEAHHRRTIVFYDKEAVMACGALGSWCTDLQQIFGKGAYSQVSSTDYILRFSSAQGNGVDEKFGMFKYHNGSFMEGDFTERPNEFVILKGGGALNPNGSIHAFYQRDCSLDCIQLDLYTLSEHKDKAYYHRECFGGFVSVDMHHPFTVRVTPQHHLSTIDFEISHFKNDEDIAYLDFDIFSIQEKISLKQQG
ncbi:CigB protein [Mucor lusitanicus]|nr:CigB protein [Mucor lusitanicus]